MRGKERKWKIFCVLEFYLRGERGFVKKRRGRFDSEIFLPLLGGKGKGRKTNAQQKMKTTHAPKNAPSKIPENPKSKCLLVLEQTSTNHQKSQKWQAENPLNQYFSILPLLGLALVLYGFVKEEPRSHEIF